MKIQGNNVFDVFLSYILNSYVNYHKLPDSPRAGITEVFDVLEKVAVWYKKA